MEAELGEIRSAWQVLARGAPAAARTLVELSQGARSEFVRAQASVAVLDRVGLGPQSTVAVDIGAVGGPGGALDAGRAAAEVLAARMAALGAGTGAVVLQGAVVEQEMPLGGAGAGRSGVSGEDGYSGAAVDGNG